MSEKTNGTTTVKVSRPVRAAIEARAKYGESVDRTLRKLLRMPRPKK